MGENQSLYSKQRLAYEANKARNSSLYLLSANGVKIPNVDLANSTEAILGILNYDTEKILEHIELLKDYTESINNANDLIIDANRKVLDMGIEVDNVNTSLSQKMNQNDEKILKGTIYSAVEKTDATNNYGRDIVYYQAVVKNPIGADYTNMPIALKIKFDKGECPSTSYILVKNSTGTSLAFQWEGETHPNYLLASTTNLATYADGSLNSGTIWILDTLGASSTNTYTIEIHSTTQAQNTTDNCPLTNDGTHDIITTGTIKFQFDGISGNYSLRRYYQNNIEYGQSGGEAIYPFYKDSSNNVFLINYSPTLFNSTKSYIGSGVVYKDYIVVNAFISDPTMTITTKYRIFSNGLCSVDCRLLATNGSSNDSIRGFGLAFKPLQSITCSIIQNQSLYGSDSNGGFMYSILNTNLATDTINATQTYNPVLEIQNTGNSGGTSIIDASYVVYSKKDLLINSLFYVKAFLIPISSTSNFTGVSNMLNNMLSVHLTKYNKMQLTKKYLSLCKKFVDHMHDQYLGTYFTGLVAYENLAYNKLNNIINESTNINGIANYINMINTVYSGGSTENFKAIYQAGRGIEYIGRDTASIMYFRKQCLSINDTQNYNTLTTVIHNLADFYVWLETYSGGNGQIILNNTGTDCFNAEATAMKALNNSLKLITNTTRQACYNRIKTRFESSILFKTNLPYSNAKTIALESLFHYHCFALFEYLNAVDFNATFDIASYINQALTSSGKVYELGFDCHSDRFGFAHTYLYAAYIMYKYNTISSLETACRLLETILYQCYPNGYHVYPLDGWIKQIDSIDLPIEIQVAYEPLIELIYS